MVLNKKTFDSHCKRLRQKNEDVAAPYINKGERPRVAILREQGVNGHVDN